MASTTIRVSKRTHAELSDLADEAEMSLTDTIQAAAAALKRERFARRVATEFASLRKDEDAWESYLGEAEQTSVTDGLS